ncbi:MAG TPA: hypothetical protein VHE30_29660 [Polyangiaceae bacterium]|nr:hypothetical protein [Polyangiaceae bacterium]
MRAGRLSRWAIAILAVALHAPVLSAGFVSDDYVVLAALEHRSPLGNGPLRLWSFHDGNPEHTRALVLGGGLPWWTEPTARHAFLRPVSSALVGVAHALFDHRAAAYHALSLGVAALDVVVAGAVFARLLPGRAAFIALASFAFHALHVRPIEWFSAIHVPLADLLGLVALLAHLRGRDDGWGPGRWVSTAALALALLAGEAGLSTVAWLVAVELLSHGSPRRAVAVLAPQLAVVAAWAMLYRISGSGAGGIDGYLDPLESPARAMRAILGRGLVEWPRLFIGGSEDLAEVGGEGVLYASGAAVLVAAALSALRDSTARRPLGVWTGATVVASLPALLGPTDRGLYVATFGAAAALGWATASAVNVGTGPARGRVWARISGGLAALVVLTSQVAGGSWTIFAAARATPSVSREERRGISALPVPNAANTDVVVLVAESQAMGPWGGVVHAWKSGERARSWQALSLSDGPHRLARVDETTFDLEPYAPGGFDPRIYRDTERHPLRVGDRFRTPRLQVEVLATEGGRATRIRVRADRPLEDRGFLWATRSERGLVQVVMPPIGQSGILL